MTERTIAFVPFTEIMDDTKFEHVVREKEQKQLLQKIIEQSPEIHIWLAQHKCMFYTGENKNAQVFLLFPIENIHPTLKDVQDEIEEAKQQAMCIVIK